MSTSRRDFLMGGAALLGASSFASPVRSTVGSMNLGYADDGTVPTAADYTQDGLVSLWDCIENVGLGEHNPDSTEWVDLVAGRKFTQVAFESDCACVVQAQRGCSFNSFHFDKMSTELVCSRVAGTTQNHSYLNAQYMRIDGSSKDMGFHAQRSPNTSRQYVGWGPFQTITDAEPEEVNFLASTFEYIDGVGYIKFYLNGRQIDYREWQREVEFYSTGIYNYIRPNNRFYRIALYGRALSGSEIAYDYQIDRRRFGL